MRLPRCPAIYGAAFAGFVETEVHLRTHILVFKTPPPYSTASRKRREAPCWRSGGGGGYGPVRRYSTKFGPCGSRDHIGRRTNRQRGMSSNKVALTHFRPTMETSLPTESGSRINSSSSVEDVVTIPNVSNWAHGNGNKPPPGGLLRRRASCGVLSPSIVLSEWKQPLDSA